jgi:serine/threonine-protein kinase
VREQSVRVQHPHVVPPTGWAADDDVVVLTMDLVRGGSVEALLARHGPLPEAYAAVLLDQTLSALTAVHAAGIVHRDVKPANLLLEVTGTARPHVRLADFGVAASVDEPRLTPWPGPIGTDGYMAPEQAQGAPPDPAQDLYAVGRVALQLITGVPPARQGPIPSHPLRPLLERLLVPDPAARVGSAEAALHLLRRLDVPFEPGPVVPDRLGHAPGTTRRSHRRSGGGVDWAAWGTVAALLGVINGCLWLLLGWFT